MAGIQLHSPSFGDHQPIPTRHAKDHDKPSPALEWSGVPEGAVELAVLCADPDAPRGRFPHWVLAGSPPTAAGLAEGGHPAGAVEGGNDFGEEGYRGPRPPVGDDPHRYVFRVFAASAPLGLVAGASAGALGRALGARSWPAEPLLAPTSDDHSPGPGLGRAGAGQPGCGRDEPRHAFHEEAGQLVTDARLTAAYLVPLVGAHGLRSRQGRDER